MGSIYGKTNSFGKIFQYDENIVTKSKSENKKIKTTIEKKEKEKVKQPKSELEKEIDSNPFFFL